MSPDSAPSSSAGRPPRVGWHACGCQYVEVVRATGSRGFVITQRCKAHEEERKRAVLAFKRRLAAFAVKAAKCPGCASMRKKYEGTIIVPVCWMHQDLHQELAATGRRG